MSTPFRSGIPRRDFIRMALAGSAFAAGASGNLLAVANTTRTAEVIIIGAGMAGLTAASILKSHGVSTIVLEGRNRIGGRIWSKKLNDTPIDLGGAWIQGAEDSPLTGLAKKFGIGTQLTPLTNIAFRQASGAPFTPGQQIDLLATFGELSTRMAVLSAERQARRLPDISMETAVTRVLDGMGLPFATRTQMKFMADLIFGELRAATLPELSFYYSSDDRNVGALDLAFPKGFGQIPAALARGVDVRLNHRVRSIAHGASAVTVGTSQGLFHARRVIVTLPLGILRDPKGVAFSPSLPLFKRLAINRLQMGTDNKVFLQFPKAFWNKEETLIFRVAGDPSRAALINAGLWVGKPIIGALLGGDYALRCEQFSDDKLANDFMDILRKSFSGPIPDPEPGVLRSRWSSDPFCYGSYSHIPPGATPRDFIALAQPVGTSLFFAGEATDTQFPGSARGAYVSGRREALRILALSGRKSNA